MLLKLHFKTLFFWHSIFLSAKHVNFLHIQTAAFAPLSWVFYANSKLFRIFAFFGFCVASNNNVGAGALDSPLFSHVTIYVDFHIV